MFSSFPLKGNSYHPFQVYVVSAQKQLMEERMKLVDELWAADIRYDRSQGIIGILHYLGST